MQRPRLQLYIFIYISNFITKPKSNKQNIQAKNPKSHNSFFDSMEKTNDQTENLSFQFPFFILIDSVLFHKITNWVNVKYHGFASRYYWSSSSSSSPKDENPKIFSKLKISSFKEEEDQEKLSSGEVKMVMENLGIFCSEESLSLGSINEMSKLFDEKEPSLEEVKEAFDVFDFNKDGFIDAIELQRVLCILGLKEGEKIENCIKMIDSFDDDKDGRIDFEDFVKFMESSF